MVNRSILAMLILSVCVVASSAKATDGPFYAGYGGYGATPWGNYGGQGLNQEHRPYFAMYPPVYYSYIEPRTFGQSPYPYLPPIAPINAQVNPPAYYQQQTGQQQSAPQPVRPLMVHNPYVTESVATPPALPVPPAPSN